MNIPHNIKVKQKRGEIYANPENSHQVLSYRL